MDDDDGPARRIPISGPRYIWAQVADDIEARIRAGEWARDERLPGRERLAAEYGVADRTVRRALVELATRGVVEVVPSKGAFATWPVH